MLKCPRCRRVTNPGEPTGQFRTMVYVDPEDKKKGKRIFESVKCCMHCAGERLLK